MGKSDHHLSLEERMLLETQYGALAADHKARRLAAHFRRVPRRLRPGQPL